MLSEEKGIYFNEEKKLDSEITSVEKLTTFISHKS